MRTSTPTSIALSASLIVGLVPFGVVAQEPLGTEPSGTLTERLVAAIANDADALGGDPATSREYVAARIGYEDYDGVLKGAVGTYLTGTANGADQAMLLQALTDPAVETRFAVCVPDETLATELVSQDAETDAGRGLALDHADEVQGQIDDLELAAAVAEVLELRSTIRLDAAEAADRLSDELYEAGYSAVEEGATGTSAHAWLQALIDGEWVDLDTTSPAGAARCEVGATYESLPETGEHVGPLRPQRGTARRWGPRDVGAPRDRLSHRRARGLAHLSALR